MKYLLLILIFFSVRTIGQTSLNSLISNVKPVKLPYSTESSSDYKEKVLHGADSTFIIQKLLSKNPFRVNPYGGTGFGNIDGEDTLECQQRILDISEISILCVFKINDIYVVHFQLTGEGAYDSAWGILALITKEGEISNWIFSNGSLGGNPHGNIIRDMTINSLKEIKIVEVSWGDNTLSYNFTVTYKIIKVEAENGHDFNYEFGIENLCIDIKL